MRKKKKKKLPPLSRLKKKAWELTSMYVRMKGADDLGYATCVTCGTAKHWKDLQAGHFIPQARGNAIRWDLRGIWPQCYRCNINLGGNGAEYTCFMLDRFGREAVDDLRRVAASTRIMRRADYEEIIDDMAGRLASLVSGDIPRVDIDPMGR